jgi:hypothetical protein
VSGNGYDVAGASRLRQVLEIACSMANCSAKELTVLSAQHDPFRVDTPARHRDGEWLAVRAAELGLADRRIHLRGLHYMLVSGEVRKPNGLPYTNTDKDWIWLGEHAAKAARWLGYLPFEQIVDARNSPPVVRILEPLEPRAYIQVGTEIYIPDADEIEPQVEVDNFAGAQPYKLVLFGEKTSLEEVLGPLAARHQADIYLPSGEISDTLLYSMARIGAEDGRPMRVLCFSDCDPAGWQMPISIARKLQALIEGGFFGGLEVEVYRVGLTPDHVMEYGLPSTPLKPTEKRAGDWMAAQGVEQTEIDALAALQPDLLRRMAREALAPFFDASLVRRVEEAREHWLREAQEAFVHQVGPHELARIQADAVAKLDAVQEQIDALNEALRVDTEGIELPEPVVPEPEVDDYYGRPLFDSADPFAHASRWLAADRAYEGPA